MKRKKEFWLELFLLCFLACLLIVQDYLILSKLNPYAIHSDLSNEISWMRYAWEHKTLLTRNFAAGNELFINRPVFLYWLFYAITGDFLFAFQLENITILLVQIPAFWFLFSKLKLNRYVRLIVLCMYLCVWSVYYNFSMYAFHPIYSVFVLAVLLTLALRISIQEEEGMWKRGSIFSLIALLGISAGLGFTSIRLAMSLYVPLLIVDCISSFVNFINGRQITQKLLKTTMVDTVCLLVNLGFYGITLHFFSDLFHPIGIYIYDVRAWLDWSVLSEQLASIVTSFGINGNGPINSVEAIWCLLRLSFAFFSLIAIVWLFRMKKEQSPEGFDRAKGILYYYISTTLVHFLLGIFSGGAIYQRYYWTSALMILLVDGTAIDRWMRLIEGKKQLAVCGIVTAGLVMLFGVNLKVYSIVYSGEPPVLSQVANYIKENEYQYVTASFWNAGAIEGYTNGAVGYQHIEIRNGDLFESTWLIDVTKYDQERLGVPNVFLLTDDEEAACLANQSTGYLINNFGTKIQEIDTYNLYAFTENPVTLLKKIKGEMMAGLPAEGVKEKTDVLSNFGFYYNNSSLNENGELVTAGPVVSGFWGPYTQSIKGVYNITLYYETDSCTDTVLGTFDVALDAQPIVETTLTSDKNSVVLENVAIDDGYLFEVRLWTFEGVVVRAQSIHYERVE